MIATYAVERRRLLETALERFLTPAQTSMVREFARAENPTPADPQAEDMLYWIRLNMPVAACRIDGWLHPED
ncbi:MAG: hypothetical protein NTX64_12940 [Elusimicrobia bacterium]|nr:hypothetical protein [Elusimicrobiota bacterium]